MRAAAVRAGAVRAGAVRVAALRAGAGLVVAALVVVAAPVGAAADEADERQVAELAERAAAGDPAAVSRLRAVDRVDGRPADLGRALDDHARPRAATLARWGGPPGAPTGPAVDGEGARRQAEEVLDDPEYQRSRTPRPLRGLLRELGELLDPVFGPVVRAVERAWDDTTNRLLVVLAAIAVVAVASAVLIRRRSRAVSAAIHRARQLGRAESPEELERAADAAERAGDAALAYRLRFRAGVLRLAGEGVIDYRPALTTGDLRRRLRSPAFDGLATRFDEVAYGGGRATPDDLDAVRTAWPRVRQETAAR